MLVRCPHCHNPIELVGESSLSEIVCPSCHSTFSIIDSATVTADAVGIEKLGRFELLSPLGAGAFGAVWMARDPELDRTVAIKVPRKEKLGSDAVEKFVREARAAPQLKHPSIVAVREVGRDGETIYIVSDFVKGVTLADWLSAHRLTVRESAELVVTIADARHHAHEQGVVYRDLKPANIMMNPEGQPHLMDFGLAKRETGEITMTVEGKIPGTPAYMSPEQARGEGHRVDRRADIYSLGVILFQLLSGELPFRGNQRMLLHQPSTTKRRARASSTARSRATSRQFA